LTQRIDPHQILDSNGVSGVMPHDVVMFLKGMAIHPQLVETQKFSA